MNRRDFLRTTSAGVAAAATLQLPLDAQNPWANLAWKGPIGLQLYTLREQFAKDPLGTLAQVSAIGYNEVEVDPFLFKLSPEDTRSYLMETNLTATSGLWMMPGPAKDWEKQIDIAGKIGLKYMVCMFVQTASEDKWKQLAADLNRAGKQCKARGIQLCYHNHILEFVPVGNTTGYEIFQTETDPHLVQFEMDIFWMTYAKQDPIAWFKRFPGRFPLLHIKDLTKDLPAGYDPRKFPGKGMEPFVEVGQGSIDWKRIFENTGLAGTKRIFVEQDFSTRSPFESIRMSLHYLRQLRLQA